MENFTNRGIEINQRKNSFWLILCGPKTNAAILYPKMNSTLLELHEEIQEISWLKNYVFQLIEEDNPVLEFMPSNFLKLNFEQLNKPLCEVSNKDLFECSMPDAVGSFLMGYIEDKMGLDWYKCKESTMLGEVFIHYKKIEKYSN